MKSIFNKTVTFSLLTVVSGTIMAAEVKPAPKSPMLKTLVAAPQLNNQASNQANVSVKARCNALNTLTPQPQANSTPTTPVLKKVIVAAAIPKASVIAAPNKNLVATAAAPEKNLTTVPKLSPVTTPSKTPVATAAVTPKKDLDVVSKLSIVAASSKNLVMAAPQANVVAAPEKILATVSKLSPVIATPSKTPVAAVAPKKDLTAVSKLSIVTAPSKNPVTAAIPAVQNKKVETKKTEEQEEEDLDAEIEALEAETQQLFKQADEENKERNAQIALLGIKTELMRIEFEADRPYFYATIMANQAAMTAMNLAHCGN